MKKKIQNRLNQVLFRYIYSCVMLAFVSFDFGLSAAEVVYNNNEKIILTLNIKNQPLEKIFSAIEEKSKCSFFYSSDLNLKQKVSISVNSVELTAELLNKVFKDTGLTFSMNGKQIYVAKKNEKQIKVFTQDKISKIEVRGRVIDENGQPVIGATVMVKGASSGTITDFDGNYIINVSSTKDILRYSFLGYSNKEEVVGNRRVVNMTMYEDVEQLAEVVVVGYGTQKKESVVGAISQIGNEELINAGTSNITNALSGKLSGVMTMQTSGQPGKNDAEIIIRGVSSWNGSKPLVLVDGVERDFSDLDPNEVETISVLKDASATAVFGARGANGVIIVTTKEGKEGVPKLSVSASHGLSWIARDFGHVNAGTTLNSYNDYLMNKQDYGKLVPQSTIQKHVNPANRLEAVLYPDVDWIAACTKKFAHVTNANANLRGGTDFINYFTSLGFLRETSFYDTYQGKNKYHNADFDFKKFNYRTNLDFKLAKSTKLQLKVGGDISINKAPNVSWRDINGASTVNYPAYYPAWMFEEYPDLYYPDLVGDRLVSMENAKYPVKFDNPYTILHRGNFTQNNSMKLFSDLILNQKLDFITKGLSFQAKVAFNTNYVYTSLQSEYNRPLWVFYPDRIGTALNPWSKQGENNFYWNEVDEPTLSVGESINGYNNSIHYGFSLSYNHTFGKHAVTGLALMNRDIKNSGSDYPYLYESWIGRVTYDFDHRYLLELNMGYTGSERFSPSNRFGFFPSLAVGWVVSQERFFKKILPWVSKFKLRYSDGLVGSDAASARWLYISDYSKNGNNITEDKIANLNAQWEEARKQDLGIELGFLNNELFVSLDLYKERRDKILLSPRYNYFVGNSFKDLNKGSLKKHGYEFEIGYRKHTSYGLNYNIKAMISFAENRIIEKDDLLYAPNYLKVSGKPEGLQAQGQVTIDGNFFNSIDESHIYPATVTTSYMINPGAYKFLDYNSDGMIDNLDIFCIPGSNYAPYVFSLSGGLKYKNFSINMVWSGNIGKYVAYAASFYNEFHAGEVAMKENMTDHWRPDNHDASYHGMGCANMGFGGSQSLDGSNLRILNYSWARANYIKLKDIKIAYDIKSKFLNRILGVEYLNVFMDGSNLLVFTKLPIGDPETKTYLDGTYPQMASVRLGININF